MAILDIARMGNPILKRQAAPVADPTAPEIARLAADMLETMAASGGVGLAAPQVSVSLQMVVYELPESRAPGNAMPARVLINPVLEPLDDEVEEAAEGCLSAPGLIGPVPRWRRIAYRGVGLDGVAIEGVAEGFHARVLQHECDHLVGRLYLSRMSDIANLAFTDEIHRQLAAEEDGK